MAEVKNNFVKSKMNKDLDDRLLSNGEYRDAQNVNVNRSEGEDVGALENVLGNKLFTNFGLSNVDNLEIIGYLTDDTNNRAFFIATNYTDFSDDMLSNVAPYGAACYILMADLASNTNQILVQGRFLNFSKTHPVYGIDLVEDLLFWTDNRNQPRKINVTKAIADNTYYTTEDQISVAKYYPYSAPQLWATKDFKILTPGGTGPTTGPHSVFTSGSGTSPATDLRVGMYFRPKSGITNPESGTGIPLQVSRGPEGPIGSGATQYYEFYTNYAVDFGSSAPPLTSLIYPASTNVADEFLPPSSRSQVSSVSSTTIVLQASPVGEILPGMLITSKEISQRVTVVSVSGPSTSLNVVSSVDLSSDLSFPDALFFSWPNPNYVNTWPGDKEFLTEKFVRFAYRFKFDDGEYSLISPFTQPAFVPKQDGYINQEIGEGTAAVSQEKDIQSSTIVSFFENSIDQVDINIQTPFIVNQLSNELKISEIDILYKESDGLAIQVLETIPVTDTSITGNSTSNYMYSYQSRKPFRTLPEKETTRVFDKVPIRALSQSVSGNRIIYGNFVDKHTPPQNLNYNVQASRKYLPGNYSTTTPTRGNSFISYPKHTLKQNRTYQVGIVLADRYGRQSDVILSSITNYQFSQGASTNVFDGSTIFHPYKDSNPNAGSSKWFGDSLKVLFRDKIPETVTHADGYPGLYKSGEYKVILSAGTTSSIVQLVSLNSEVAVGDIVTGTDSNGAFVDSIVSLSGTNIITLNNAHTINQNAVLTIYGPENKLGWYTYKIVVKQQAQEYYNAYLPSLSQGQIENGLHVDDKRAGYTTLISDNVNKIPSDLTEVQPEQTQFRTSDEILYPRVGPYPNQDFVGFGKNAQYYVNEEFITVDTMAKVTDLGIQASSPVTPITARGIYDPKSNPPVARLSLYNTNIGGIPVNTSSDRALQVSAFEVKPPESRLEIYWETSTCGLISELNTSVENGAAAVEESPTSVN